MEQANVDVYSSIGWFVAGEEVAGLTSNEDIAESKRIFPMRRDPNSDPMVTFTNERNVLRALLKRDAFDDLPTSNLRRDLMEAGMTAPEPASGCGSSTTGGVVAADGSSTADGCDPSVRGAGSSGSCGACSCSSGGA